MDSIYANIIQDIKEKSHKRLIGWMSSSYEGVYEANLGKGSIMITFDLAEYEEYKSNTKPSSNSPIVSLSFLNERGEVFKSIDCYSTLDSNFNDLKEIYESAHNNYMKIDETLQSMLDDLNGRK